MIAHTCCSGRGGSWTTAPLAQACCFNTQVTAFPS
ncbi:hypothetical protein [Stenotrophomonas sp. P5_B8]